MIDDEQRKRHARSSLRLMLLTAGIFAGLALFMPLVAAMFSGYSFLRFPLSLFLAGQGIIIGIIATIFWAAKRQDRLDRRYGLTNEF
jgi:putative solute:sodium symporter small subunit